ncbi:hypothetical protein ACKWTF_003283 [Chironomus riparius]
MKHHMSRKTKIATTVFVIFVIGLGVLLWYTYRLGDTFSGEEEEEEYLATGAIVTNVEECTYIARSILKLDGSAVDAAIAVTFCYGVAQPQASGIGGGFLATIFIKGRKKIETLNAREVAPLKISEDMYKENLNSSFEGGLSIAVPTEVKGLWELHQKYGKLSWKTLIKPSIDLAEKGFTVPSYLAKVLIAREEKIRSIKLFRDLYINPATNTIYHEGEKMTNPKLAETLKIIAEEGVDAIYSEKGSLGHKLVEEIQANGGVVSMDDFTSYNPKWGSSVSTKLFNGDTLHTTPIPSSGCLIPFILNILEGYKLYENSLKYHDENKLIYHRIVEAFKFAFGERTKLGDVLNADVVEAVRELQNVDYANRIITFINDEHTFNDTSYYGVKGPVTADYGTAHVSILATNGDAISLTTTINVIFGSWIISESTGIVYNNEIDDFSIPSASDGLLESKANSIQPAKSPMSSMAPIIVLNENHEVTLAVGGSGRKEVSFNI